MKLPAVLPESWLRLLSEDDRRTFAPGQMTFAEAESKAAVKCERALQGHLVGLLRVRGVTPLWFRTDKRSRATVGWPDITFAVLGRAIAWEVKLPGQVPRKEQILQHTLMIRNGWIVDIVHGVDEGRALLDSYGTRSAQEG